MLTAHTKISHQIFFLEKWTFKKNIKVEIQSYKSTERQYSGPKGQKDEQ